VVQGHSYTSDDGRRRTRNVVKAQQVDEDQPTSERPDPAPRGIEPFDDPSLIGRVSACFLTGVILTAPITMPILLVWLFLTFLDAHVAGLWPERYNQATYCRSACRGSGCLVMLAFPTLVGMLTAGFAGRILAQTGGRLLSRSRSCAAPTVR
jgi:hypothetical protein